MKKQVSGKEIASKLMNERVLIGWEIMTRKECYDMLIADGCGERCADFFAFGTPAYREEGE